MSRTIMPIMGATLLSEIPFAMLREGAAWRNHGQSLETLASRGGLSTGEAIDILEGSRWGTTRNGIDSEHRLINKVRVWRAEAASKPASAKGATNG